MNDAEARRFLTSLLRNTGLGSYRVGDLLYATGPNTLGKLPPPAASSMVLHGGEQPSWEQISMDEVEGVLAAENGGTGLSSYALGDLLYASGVDTLTTLAGQTTTTRKFLRQVGDGSISAAPAWDTLSSADIADFNAAALAAILAADGPGSGLDADLLDGMSSAAFLQTATYQALTPTWSGNHAWANNAEVRFGNTAALRIFHDGTNNQVRADSGETRFTNSGTINFKYGNNGSAWAMWTNGAAFLPVSFDEVGTPIQASVQNYGTAATSGSMIICRANASGDGGRIALMRNATNSQTNTALPINTRLGELSFHGADGTVYGLGARLRAVSNAAFTGTDHATRLELLNVAAGSVTPVVRLALVDTQVLLAVGSATLPGLAGNTDTDTGFHWPGSNQLLVVAGAGAAARFDASTTAGDTRLLVYDVDNATLERVTVGAADSGGAGFKVLRIPN